MTTYTLKTYSGLKDQEIFANRSVGKLGIILKRDKFHHAGESGPFGEIMHHPDIFRVYNALGERLFEGNVNDTLSFLRKIK